MNHNYPKTRKLRKPWLHESKITCPECGFTSIKKVVSRHYYVWHIKRVLEKLLFNNPCTGCLNLDKSMKKLSLDEYQKLCQTHRTMYDEEFD